MNDAMTVSQLNRGKRQKVKGIAQTTESGYMTFLFIALSRQNWANTVKEGIGHFIFFPIAAGLAIVKAAISFYDLLKSKNKNLSKIGNFLVDTVVALIISTAVIGGLVASALFATLAPILFTIALGLNAFYNLGKTITNTYHWAKAENEFSRQQYKAAFKRHLIGTGLGFALTIGIALMMVFKVVPTIMSIACAVTAGMGFILGIHGTVKSLGQNQTLEKISFQPTSPPEKDKTNTHTDQQRLISNYQLDFSNNNASKWNYYHRTNRIAILDNFSSFEDKRIYLIKELTAKINVLHAEIDTGKNSFFGKYQEHKRSAKIELLSSLRAILMDEDEVMPEYLNELKVDKHILHLKNKTELLDKKIYSISDLLNHASYRDYINKAFQSVLREVGDVQDIFDAAGYYLDEKANTASLNKKIA